MPKYKFALKNGKTLTLEGDTQPSDDEVEKIAKDQGVELQPVEEPTESISIKPEQYTQQPKTTTPDVTGEETNTEPEQGWLGRAWHAISDPLTDLPSRVAKTAADYIDQPSLERSPMMARVAGFGAGALQGIGDLVSGATSPVNLATAALTGGTSLAENAGYGQLGNLLRIGTRVASAPTAVHGVEEMLNPSSTMGERGRGLTELAGGLAAMKGAETPTSKAAEIPKETPKTTVPPTTDVTQPKYAMGIKVIIKSSKATPELVKKAREQGFEFDGLNDEGHFRFVKTSEPVKQPILESEVGTARPTRQKLGEDVDTRKTNAIAEAANFPRTVMASIDMSAPLRQGLGLIHKKEFWTALPDMFKAWGSEDAFNQVQQSIAEKPLFKRRVNPTTGKELPSFAEDAGLKLTDLHDLSSREESMMSSWAEKVPGVRASNRAYTSFLNKLRADTFESLVEEGKVFGADAGVNKPLARELANFVNTATGRGSLGSLESSAGALSTVLFSPRLMASRLQMMNPYYYITANPMVRKEALKSLMSIAAVGNTVAQLGKMAGGKVETDPASADYGKVHIGNIRIDPYGGFQQYIVAAQRLLPHIDLSSMGLGKNLRTNTGIVPVDLATNLLGSEGGMMKSTTTGLKYGLGEPKYGQSTRADVALRFLRGKTNPIINFGWGLMAGQKELSGKHMQFGLNPSPNKAFGVFDNSVAQRFIPMLMQDVWDLYQSEKTPVPAKVAAGVLSGFGMGSQTYGNR